MGSGEKDNTAIVNNLPDKKLEGNVPPKKTNKLDKGDHTRTSSSAPGSSQKNDAILDDLSDKKSGKNVSHKRPIKTDKKVVKKTKISFSNSLANVFSSGAFNLEKLNLWNKTKDAKVGDFTKQNSKSVKQIKDCDTQISDSNNPDRNCEPKQPNMNSCSSTDVNPISLQDGSTAPKSGPTVKRKKRRCRDQSCLPCSISQDCLKCDHCLKKHLK